MGESVYWKNGDVAIMRFEDIFWPDSEINKITIANDEIKIEIFDDAFQRSFSVLCTGVIGIEGLCIWEDITILHANLTHPIIKESLAGQKLYKIYGGYPSMETILSNITSLSIELIDNQVFTIYCQNISFSEDKE